MMRALLCLVCIVPDWPRHTPLALRPLNFALRPLNLALRPIPENRPPMVHVVYVSAENAEFTREGALRPLSLPLFLSLSPSRAH